MQYRITDFNTKRGLCGIRRATFSRCIGVLEYNNNKHDKFRYKLEWKAEDGHAHGRADCMTAASLAETLQDFSFSSLECEPEIVIELLAAGFPMDIEPIENQSDG